MTDQGGKFCGASPARMKTSSGELDAHYDAVMTSSPKRVMCLMSDTGGGHRASAQALKDGFEVLYGEQKPLLQLLNVAPIVKRSLPRQETRMT